MESLVVSFLLQSQTKSLVRIGKSRIHGAGNGIFSTRTIEKNTATCLYPGIYTPGFPIHVSPTDDAIYMGNEVTPSGIPPEKNAYILNIRLPHGGYIDGAALEDLPSGVAENPLYSGHLINHSSLKANQAMLPFVWGPILDQESLQHTRFDLPNKRRCDGSPWYSLDGKLHCFDSRMGPVCGGVFVSTKRVEEGEELLFNYGLHPPLPEWAKPWYH